MPWLRSARRADVPWLVALLCFTASSCETSRVLNPHATVAPGNSTGLGRTVASMLCIGDMRGSKPVVKCGPMPKPGIRASARASATIFGRQNIDVTLTPGTVTYDAATDTLSVNFTITNLLAQQLGTPDGTTITKVRAFVNSGPSVVGGTGVVTIVADSISAFNNVNQPYYIYNQIIASQATSAVRTWKLIVPGTVTQFYAGVEVSADVPSAGGVEHWTTIRPAGISLQTYESMWANTPSDIYAVSLTGLASHYDGNAWSLLPLPPTVDLLGVYGFSGPILWAVGAGGARFLYSGSGLANYTFSPTVNDSLYAVWGSSSSDVYAVGQAATILHWTGTSWTQETPPSGVTSALQGVWGTSDGDTVYAVGQAGVIVMRVAGTWTTLTNPAGTNTLYGIWGTGTTFYAVGAAGTIVTTTGGSWTQVTSGTSASLRNVNGTGTGDIYADGLSGVVLHYNGIVWSSVPTPFAEDLYTIYDGGPGATTWALGQSGAIFSYDGTTWALDPSAGNPINSLWGTSPTDLWAAGLYGILLHYNGTTWTLVPAGAPVSGLWGTSTTNVMGAGQGLSFSNYNGLAWTPGTLGVSSSQFYDVWGSSASNAYAVGDAGTIYQYTGGTTWAAMTQSATTQALFGVGGTSASNIFAVGNTGAMIQFNGTTWSAMTAAPGNAQMFGVAAVDSAHVYAVGAAVSGRNGTVLTYNGSGATWTNASGSVPHSLRGIWAADTADVYAVGDVGTVWAFNGSAWYLLSTGVTSNLRGVFGTSASNVYVSGDFGLVMVGTQ